MSVYSGFIALFWLKFWCISLPLFFKNTFKKIEIVLLSPILSVLLNVYSLIYRLEQPHSRFKTFPSPQKGALCSSAVNSHLFYANQSLMFPLSLELSFQASIMESYSRWYFAFFSLTSLLEYNCFTTLC